MSESVDQVRLEFFDNDLRPVAELIIVAEKPDTLQKLTREEASIWGEEPVQLLENASYEFLLSSPEFRIPESSIVSYSKLENTTQKSGRITPHSYTGLLPLDLVKKNNPEIIVARAAVEVRSRKLNYREDYRYMLDDIAEECSDLLMNLRSPSKTRMITDPTRDVESISQRFAFVSSILRSTEFRTSINRIMKMPHTKFIQEVSERPIEQGIKLGSKSLREIASRTNRRELPKNHPLHKRLLSIGIAEPSVPTKLSISKNIDTTDTPENRFIKHSLNNYSGFLNSISNKISSLKPNGANTRLLNEISQLSVELNSILARDFFKDISAPQNLSLSSPVLQKRSGYRELLQIWLRFNLAANLIWNGGADVFDAGKKDLDKLYEYWLFFKLLRIVRDVFEIAEPSINDLFENRSDGFGLKLRSGKSLNINGSLKFNERKINIVFSYNRTFSQTNLYTDAGSWSLQMIPDFTLSIYPEEFTIVEAEAQEIMAHIHFDAKYKLNRIEDILEDDISDEKKTGVKEEATRTDLLKMHSYKDAIRRTVGSYILYPGTEDRIIKGYHEILPSLGAFAVRPEENDSPVGMNNVRSFINDIVRHICSKATDRERTTYYKFQSYSSGTEREKILLIPTDEKTPNKLRNLPPRDRIVLIINSDESGEQAIINEKGLTLIFDYPIKMKPFLTNANYLLYFEKGIWTMYGVSDCPIISNEKESIISLSYNLFKTTEFDEVDWNVDKIINEKFTMSFVNATDLEQLMNRQSL